MNLHRRTIGLLLFFGLPTAGLFSQAQPNELYTGPLVTFYENANYRGNAFTLKPGDSIENLNGFNFDQGGRSNDRISSIRIQGNVEVVLFENSRFGGHVMRITQSVRNLADRRLPPDVQGTWNDRISSIQVDETRRTPRPQAPEVIIRRAYLDVLGRPADPEGLSYFRSLVVDQGWDERMVRDQLYKSDEYRTEGVNRIIIRAYKDVLKREPDPEGLENYRRLILDQGWTDQQIRAALRNSDEYKNRQK